MAEASKPLSTPQFEEDLSELTPRAVLQHALHDAKPEIRVRAADLLLRDEAPDASGARDAGCAQIFFGPKCASGKPCQCADCQAFGESVRNAADQTRPEYPHGNRRDVAPARLPTEALAT